MNNIIIPENTFRFPNKDITNTITDEESRILPSLLYVFSLVFKILVVAAIPITRVKFVMLLPIILPIATPLFPLSVPIIDAANSGNEVPIATNVRPIKNSDTPNLLAIFDEWTTKISVDLINKIRPKMKKSIENNSIV